jgi:hypothetical protein
MDLRAIDRLIGKEIFGVQELTVEEAVEKFAKKSFRTFTHDGCIVDKYTKLKFDKGEYDRRFKGGYYIPTWKQWLIENSTVVMDYPRYSSDIEYAWEVVEKLSKDGFDFQVRRENNGKYNVEFTKDFFYTFGFAESETAPLAICIAALKSVGVEVEVNEQ